MDRTVPLREANQSFARIVREAESGTSFTITRKGVPVARIVPMQSGRRRLTPEQEAARERSRVRMARGWPMGIGRFDRDALHER